MGLCVSFPGPPEPSRLVSALLFLFLKNYKFLPPHKPRMNAQSGGLINQWVPVVCRADTIGDASLRVKLLGRVIFNNGNMSIDTKYFIATSL